MELDHVQWGYMWVYVLDICGYKMMWHVLGRKWVHFLGIYGYNGIYCWVYVGYKVTWQKKRGEKEMYRALTEVGMSLHSGPIWVHFSGTMP